MIRSRPDLLYVSHVDGRGTALFREICRLDLEGILAEYKHAPDGLENSWVKIKNSSYSQIIRCDELFKKRSA
jgi:ATP-dependent DNA ligase